MKGIWNTWDWKYNLHIQILAGEMTQFYSKILENAWSRYKIDF